MMLEVKRMGNRKQLLAFDESIKGKVEYTAWVVPEKQFSVYPSCSTCLIS